jgi:hypothetical protein
MRALVALGVIALLSPWASGAVAIHLVVDHDGHWPHGGDASAGLHGHHHSRDTPDHDHGLQGPLPTVRGTQPVDAPAYAFDASLGAPATVLCLTRVSARDVDGAARASPIAATPSVLRI